MIQHTKNDYINLSALYGIAVLCVISLSFVAKPLSLLQSVAHAPSKKQETTIRRSFFDKTAFSEVKIHGKAYIVYDIVDGTIIASKNETAVLPLASVTKLMMAITARLHHEKDTKIVLRKESVEDGFDLGLKKNQTWNLDELLKYTLVFSSNDGAQAIADNLGGRKVFVEQMNTDASLLGFSLRFTSPTGLDINGNIGGEGSALEIAKLLAVARKNIPEILDATTRTRATVVSSTGKVSGIPNTNQDILNFSGAEASKTGYTDKAGGNLAVIVDITLVRPVAIVVLGSTHEERFLDVKVLYEALKASVEVLDGR
jgi:D-alanyl-D-alanine carboxypeptidase